MVAVKYAATIWPTTDSFAYGEVVPIPTLPPVVILILPPFTTPMLIGFIELSVNKESELSSLI